MAIKFLSGFRGIDNAKQGLRRSTQLGSAATGGGTILATSQNFDPQACFVYLNGSLLREGTSSDGGDYVLSGNSTVTFNSAVASTDVIEVVSYNFANPTLPETMIEVDHTVTSANATYHATSVTGASYTASSDTLVKTSHGLAVDDVINVTVSPTSGSLAVGRLAEAKGAIELLLANAYSSRDLVALISFRGDNAETLLTPTRSLSKTKRVLCSLPGGGGTPLASGLMSALKLSIDYSQKGFSPVSIILTDGKANIDLDGEKGRIKALEDSSQVSKLFVSNKLKTMVIDTSQRISQTAKDLAKNLGGEYVLLPRANAHQLSNMLLNKLN